MLTRVVWRTVNDIANGAGGMGHDSRAAEI